MTIDIILQATTDNFNNRKDYYNIDRIQQELIQKYGIRSKLQRDSDKVHADKYYLYFGGDEFVMEKSVTRQIIYAGTNWREISDDELDTDYHFAGFVLNRYLLQDEPVICGIKEIADRMGTDYEISEAPQIKNYSIIEGKKGEPVLNVIVNYFKAMDAIQSTGKKSWWQF